MLAKTRGTLGFNDDFFSLPSSTVWISLSNISPRARVMARTGTQRRKRTSNHTQPGLPALWHFALISSSSWVSRKVDDKCNRTTPPSSTAGNEKQRKDQTPAGNRRDEKNLKISSSPHLYWLSAVLNGLLPVNRGTFQKNGDSKSLISLAPSVESLESSSSTVSSPLSSSSSSFFSATIPPAPVPQPTLILLATTPSYCRSVCRELSAQETIAAHVCQDQLSYNGPLKEWQREPELPSASELMDRQPPPLPESLDEDDTPTKSDYLEMQYRLQRYEGIEPLRQAVNHFRENPAMMEEADTYVYTKVHVKGYLMARAGAACRISFSTERTRSKVNWRQSKRLTAGTLVALSGDNFQTQCFVAVVGARYIIGGLEPDFRIREDPATLPRIEIFWANYNDATLDPTTELVMLEASVGYYEQVRHAMLGLQHAAFYSSKFDKYFVDGYNRDSKAAYLKGAPSQRAVVPEATVQFDTSQMKAFERMTSQELAIVQGPPGTGKTFTSVIALESHTKTLQTLRVGDEAAPPVIVAAQTNHALDQLLGHCMERDISIARIGGRSKIEAINDRTIFNIRQRSKISQRNVKGESAHKLVLQKIQDLLSKCFPDGFISPEHLLHEGLISQEQLTSLNDDEWETASTANSDEDDDTNSGLLQRWLGENAVQEDLSYNYRPARHETEAPALENEPEGNDQLSLEDDEKQHLQGDFLSTEVFWTGSVPSTMARNETGLCFQAERLLQKNSDLYKIKPPQRGLVYRYWRKKLIGTAAIEFPNLLREYQKASDNLSISRFEVNVKVLQQEGIQVIGCTTTGLTKYRGMIAALKPRVLMIEEAAETQEAKITSALYPSLDQIVLVGDHQQLVPHTVNRILGQPPYNLDVSLFERLVRLEIPYTMLRVQRRMIPIIREVVHAFYPRLEDHESVKNRPPIPGMGDTSLWWFQHQWGENKNDDLSYYNMREAEMMVGFVKYLVQNDVTPSMITILTYYNGQVNLVLEKLRKDPLLSSLHPTKEWFVKTVDGFQGEENEIILLSLVRSPSNIHNPAKAGFVEDENRAVVATSRARRGMYVFGNSNNILYGSKRSKETWQKVYDVFERRDCIGFHLPVTCKNHSKVTEVRNPDDWSNLSGGGCQQLCDKRCPMGHPCENKCHAFEQARVKCKHPYEKMLACGHACTRECWDKCRCRERCNEPSVTKVMPIQTKLPASAPGRVPLGPQADKSANTGKGKRGFQNGKQAPQQGKNAQQRGKWTPATRNWSQGRQNKNPSNVATSPGAKCFATHGKRALTSSGASSKAQTTPALEKPHRKELTSDDLMDTGYRAFMTRHDNINQVASGQSESSTLLVDSPLVDLEDEIIESLADMHMEPLSSGEESISEKWSPRKVAEKERDLETSLAEDRKKARPLPQTMIRETFRPATPGLNGTRTLGKAIRVEHTIVAVSEASKTPKMHGDSKELFSRKQEIINAAAGFWYDVGADATKSVSVHAAPSAKEDVEMELVRFVPNEAMNTTKNMTEVEDLEMVPIRFDSNVTTSKNSPEVEDPQVELNLVDSDKSTSKNKVKIEDLEMDLIQFD
ncbi:hypothetical protein G7046_g3695 [Stylonectria norvegica]|nr:hypothetical protein G7046_g3695 [Stylonectria norvegica]